MLITLKYLFELSIIAFLFYAIILVFHELFKSKTRKLLESHGFIYVRNGRYLIELPDPVVIDFNLKTVDLMNGISYQFKQPIEESDMIDLFAHAMKDSGLIYQLESQLRDLVVSRHDDVICWKLMVDP